jgi:hypothetical protein
MGKVLLNLWRNPKASAKRPNLHLQKQGAVASVLVAHHVVSFLREKNMLVPVRREETPEPLLQAETDKIVEQIARAMSESESGRFARHVDMRAIDKTKQLALYHDDWAAEAGLDSKQFSVTDVKQIHNLCRQAVEAMGDDLVMTVGRAIYLADRDERPRPQQ